MLGSTVARLLNEQGLEIIEGNRSGVAVASKSKAIKIDANTPQDFTSVFQSEDIRYVINCIGLIKQLISESKSESTLEAIRVNSIFPRRLEKFANLYNFRIIQIATDCVFSGDKGDYSEVDVHSPLDVYGMTKSLGEIRGPNVMILRCSIIGPEQKGNNSLLSWFLSQPLNSEIIGYPNHMWNGLTTLHFAKIIAGIIREDFFIPGLHHLVPADVESKGTLLELFRKHYGRTDLRISHVDAPTLVNRILKTATPSINLELWKMAGYNFPPTIEQMVDELANWTAIHSEGVSK
jgi:dTDP-4-dehydrorhamnose reductase